jgi:hypothetical protein
MVLSLQKRQDKNLKKTEGQKEQVLFGKKKEKSVLPKTCS